MGKRAHQKGFQLAFNMAGYLGLDLGGSIAEKIAFNLERPDHKPGARLTKEGGEC